MAITLVSNGVGSAGFAVNGSSADLSGCETLVAGVAGKSIYVDALVLSFGAELTATLGAGEATGSVAAVLVGPVYGAANTTVVMDFGNQPLTLPAATALVADASGAGNITIFCRGRVQ